MSLAAVDIGLLSLAKECLSLAREWELSASTAALLFPPGFMGGWGSLSALLVGLVVTGGYASEERWAKAPTIFRGIAIGTALAMWQSIDVAGIVWTGSRWTLVVLALGSLLAIARYLLGVAVVRGGKGGKPGDRTILVGDPHGPAGRRWAEALSTRPGTHSLGWLSERGDVDDYLGHPSAVWEVLSETGTDTVVLCGDLDRAMFDTVVEAAAVAGCRVLSIRPQGTMTASQPKVLGHGNLRMLELTFPAGRAGQDVLKRAFDILVSSTLLFLMAPLLALISLAIKLDSIGRVVFIQERVGQAGKIFPMWKFRTMSDGADDAKGDLAHLNISRDPRLFKIPNDPRVTRVGRLLRRWSLDEVPQFWNVLRGQMSLVGPRPFFESDLEAYDDHHFIRLTVKPGLTGLWQVKGRSSIVDFEEVIDLDREYVERWSFGLDLKILFATLPAVLRRTGAY